MKAYIDAPQVVGKHLVRQRQVMKQPVTSALDPAGKVHVLGRKAIEALVELCKEQSPATYEDYLKSMFPGGLNVTNVPKQQLQMSMSIYNPRCVAGPLLDVVIDGRTYACDLEALEEHLGEDPFVEVEDITAGELMAFSGAVERLDDTNKGAG
ncbi:hypothetical protein WME76_22665 [Sorangium sp. So ce119]|uniref:hypothetical protein n=1 Tax=Sorangium sp. So ce119 TaxID=3133279 RepID=UPI003F5ED8B8